MHERETWSNFYSIFQADVMKGSSQGKENGDQTSEQKPWNGNKYMYLS